MERIFIFIVLKESKKILNERILHVPSSCETVALTKSGNTKVKRSRLAYEFV